MKTKENKSGIVEVNSRAFAVKVLKSAVETKSPVRASSNPFGEGTLIGTLFSLGSGKQVRTLREVINEDIHLPVWNAARKMTESGRRVRLSMADKFQRAHWQYTIIACPKHPTNHGRARSVEIGRGLDKMVHFEALR